jgi:hypothetical protein
MNTSPRFLVRDDSGRDVGVEWTLAEMLADPHTWDLDYTNDEDDEYELSIRDWIAGASIGDEYHHDEQRLTIICIG